MDDSWDLYDQTRKLFIAAFAAGEIDYQQYVNKTQKALKEFLALVANLDNQKKK